MDKTVSKVDCSKVADGQFEINDSAFELYNFNQLPKNSYLVFKNCNVQVMDNFGSEFTPLHYIFEKCVVSFANMSLHMDNRYAPNLLRMLSQNAVSCNELKIWCGNVNLIDRESAYLIMGIDAKTKMMVIGNEHSRQNVTPYITALQRYFDSVYCYNLNFPKRYNIGSSKVLLSNCSGNLENVRGAVTVMGDKTPYLDLVNDTTVYVGEFERLEVGCDDTFNIFLKNPRDFKKVNYTGIINKTNCSVVDRYKKKLYKFKTFINVDFTVTTFIQQFFNCRFYNCCFNENQMVLNSKAVRCHFLCGTENFLDTHISN